MNVAIDLDNTLLTWEGDGATCGQWLEGAKEALDEILGAGIAVIIHTCRTTWEAGGGAESVFSFFVDEGYSPEPVTDSWGFAGGKLGIWVGTGKPVAMAYVDDRAVPFDGSWEYALEKINDFVHGRLDTP